MTVSTEWKPFTSGALMLETQRQYYQPMTALLTTLNNGRGKKRNTLYFHQKQEGQHRNHKNFLIKHLLYPQTHMLTHKHTDHKAAHVQSHTLQQPKDMNQKLVFMGSCICSSFISIKLIWSRLFEPVRHHQCYLRELRRKVCDYQPLSVSHTHYVRL